VVQGLRSLEDGFVPRIFDPPSSIESSSCDREVDRMDARLLDSAGFRRDLVGRVMAASQDAATMERGTTVALVPDAG